GAQPQRPLPPAAEVRPVKPASHERQILLLAMLTGLPGTTAALVLLWRSAMAPKFQWSLTAALVILWLSLVFALRARVVFPLRTLSNLLSALREGDFSIRARGESREDALGQLISGSTRSPAPSASSAWALWRPRRCSAR